MHSGIKFVLIVITSIILLSVSGCYYDKEQFLYPAHTAVVCSTINAKFSTDIKPLILTKCATSGCHSAADAAGGTILETYAQISAKASRINQRCIVDKTMPPGTALTQAEINMLICWIQSGLPNN